VPGKGKVHFYSTPTVLLAFAYHLFLMITTVRNFFNSNKAASYCTTQHKNLDMYYTAAKDARHLLWFGDKNGSDCPLWHLKHPDHHDRHLFFWSMPIKFTKMTAQQATATCA